MSKKTMIVVWKWDFKWRKDDNSGKIISDLENISFDMDCNKISYIPICIYSV